MVGAVLDWRSVQRALAASPSGVPRAMRELRAPMRTDQKEHAREQRGPDGPWPKRKTAAQVAAGDRRRRSRKRPSRRRVLGRLPGAIKISHDRTSVVVSSKVPWSLAHQEGAIVGHGARLPKREFLWISPKLRGIAVALLEQNMVEAFNRGSL